jgi:hypothetical protein
MSQDNSVLPVPFHGATLTLIDHHGKPYVAMRPIVEAMGMDWTTQHQKIKARYGSTVGISPTVGATVTEIVTVAEDGKQRRMTCLPLCKIGGWLMTIHANKVRPELRDTILAYQNECDEALWNYWSKGHATRPAASAGESSIRIDAHGQPYLGTLPPPDPLADPKVRIAINRKAHALSLAAFEHNRDILEAWLRRCGDITDPQAAIERIHALDLEHGKHVLADLQLLHDLTNTARTIHRSSDIQMQAIARLEAATGRQLHG